MSYSNRGLLAALAGLAALFVATGTGAYLGSLYAPEKRHYQTVGPNGGQEYPADSPRNGLADVSGIDGLAQGIIAKPQPRNTEEREQRDLAAQESMAVFAYWMFWAMILQTCLAAGALIALIKDLRQNRKSAEQQLRAYLTLREFVWNADKRDFTLQIEWVNKGQTPAYEADAWANWTILNKRMDEDFPFASPATPTDCLTVIGPEQAILGTCSGGPTYEQMRDAGTGDSFIYLWGEAFYTDAFGGRRITQVAVMLDVEILDKGGFVVRWKSVPQHNKAT